MPCGYFRHPSSAAWEVGSERQSFTWIGGGMVRHPRKSWIFLEDFFPGTPPEWAPPPGGVHKKNPPHNMGFGRLNPTNFYRIFFPPSHGSSHIVSLMVPKPPIYKRVFFSALLAKRAPPGIRISKGYQREPSRVPYCLAIGAHTPYL